MLRYIFIICCICLFFIRRLHATAPENTSLSGKVTDKTTGEVLVGVAIYAPDLKTGAVTQLDGSYKINNLPHSKILLHVSYLGYKTILETVDLDLIASKDFQLESTVKEINEVVVTGVSKATERNRTPVPITLVPKLQLLQTSSSNIVDALTKQPGISQITTAPGISKPIIRGLGYNRVVVVNDGIRQEGQQWGDEHGIEIDEYSVDKVEILKGPASLAYGSDAMAGVINMITAPTLPDGTVKGNVIANYQSNNGLIGGSGNVAANKNGFILDLRYSNKQAHAYQNPYDGYVLNSGFKESAVSGIFGLNKSWGYSHLHLSAYNLIPGIVEGERDSVSGKFVKPVELADGTEGAVIASTKDYTSYKQLTPYQEIHHYKAVLNNSFIVGHGTLKAILGFQQNQRKEFADVLTPNQYGLYFLLNTLNYNLAYTLPEKNNLSISFGVNGMRQSSENKGTEFLVPAYSLFDVGMYTTAHKHCDNLDISGGLRYDARSQQGNKLLLDSNETQVQVLVAGGSTRFGGFNNTYRGMSGSLGATYQIGDAMFTKLNFSRGFRAPNIAEIGANGVHEGTLRYEIGNAKLKPETSFQVDYTFGVNTKHVSIELNLFNNRINNFIFLSKLNSVAGGDSIRDALSTFKYTAGTANLYGGEIAVDVHPHPLDWLHIENSLSFVEAQQLNQPDSSKYLPYIPAAKLQSELRADIKKVGAYFRNYYVKASVEYFFAQNNIYTAFNTETRTPGYTLLNAGFGADISIRAITRCSIYISASNLMDVAYQSHLSRLKYAAVNNATGRNGIYNMGRNVSVKLVVPF